MTNILFERFLSRDGVTAKKYSDVPQSLIEHFKGQFITGKDDGFDILMKIWQRSGFCVYQKGLFSIINPEEYSEIVRKFSNVPKTAIPFARTGVGSFFIWDKKQIGESIFYLNVHKNQISVVSTSFLVFFGINLGAHNWWIDECYGKIELKAIEKYGPVNHDECMTFVPALALGGDESIFKMEKVSFKENLNLLAQLHSG